MTRYMQRHIIADAWQMISSPVDLPQWLWSAHKDKEFTRVFGDDDEAFSHGVINKSDKDHVSVTRVEIGDWVVLSNDGLVRMTDADFRTKYQEIPGWQGDLFEQATEIPVMVHHTGPVEADEPEKPEWFEFDSSKPASTMSVRDHVFLELFKTRMVSSGLMKTTTLLFGHDDMVDTVLAAMGYD